MIIISYESKSDRVTPLRNGSPQTLEFIPSEFDPFTYNTTSVHAYSNTGFAKKTTTLAEWETATITTPYIENIDVDNWLEFYESVRRGEVFTVDARLISGIIDIKTVFIPQATFGVSRFVPCIGFKSTFNVRTVDVISE